MDNGGIDQPKTAEENMNKTVYVLNYWEKPNNTSVRQALVTSLHPTRESAITELMGYIATRLENDKGLTSLRGYLNKSPDEIRSRQGTPAINIAETYFNHISDSEVDADFELGEMVVENPVLDVCERAISVLDALLGSAVLDPDAEAKDLREAFDAYNWEKAEDADADRFAQLLGKGPDMSHEEMEEFVSMLAPDSENHPFGYIHRARELVDQYDALRSDTP